jgi:hypothetical protein
MLARRRRNVKGFVTKEKSEGDLLLPTGYFSARKVYYSFIRRNAKNNYDQGSTVVNMEELNLVRKIISRTPYTSAADRFFWPPRSGSVNQRYGSGSFISSSKNSNQNLDSYCFVTFYL